MAFQKGLARLFIRLSIRLGDALEHLAVRIDPSVETRQDLDDICQHMPYDAQMRPRRDAPDDLAWLDDEPWNGSAHTG